MKKALVVVGLTAIAALVGCQAETDETDMLLLAFPDVARTVKQGDKQIFHMSVGRGKGFKGAVNLQAKVLDDSGITVDLDRTTVQPGDKGRPTEWGQVNDVQLTISATEKASLGEQEIMITCMPDKNEPPGAVKTSLRVTVIAK